MTKKKRAYIAGPMRSVGPPAYNAAAFNAAETELLAMGYEVFNPASLPGQEFTDESNRRALEAELTWICRYADFVLVLDGWEKSLGAAAEIATASAVGIPAVSFKQLKETLHVARI